MSDKTSTDNTRDPEQARIAKVMARAGVASRRDAEAWIAAGRVSVNGKVIASPALNVGPRDVIAVDGKPLPGRERTRLWLYHKPRGLVTTARDPEGRTTVFEVLPPELPRVVSVGRLDLNTEGLLLLTNDGGLARVLAHPSTAWLRRYRVRAFGQVELEKLDALKQGIEIDGFSYGPIEAAVDRQQGDNVWLTLGLREGKNREVRRVLEHLGLSVNRLIRLSFGPFQLGDLGEGAAEEIRTRYLKDQLGSLADEAGCDFDAPLIDRTPEPVRRALKEREARAEAPRRRAGLTEDRKGRRVVVERIEKDKTEKDRTKERKPARPARPRADAPRPGADERPQRTFRPREDRPVRNDRPGERPMRDERPFRGDRPARPERPFRGDRPSREDGSFVRERNPRGERPDGERRGPPRGAAGPRPFGPRPFAKRDRDEAGDQPEKKSEPRPYGNRVRAFRARPPREDGDRAERRGPPKDQAPRAAGDSRPPRRDGDSRPPRRDGENRPPRRDAEAGRPSFRDGQGRPPRRDGDKPRGFGGKPGGRPGGFGKPGGGPGGKPGARPGGFGKPGGRPSGGPSRGGRPDGKPGGRPGGGRPGGKPRP